MVGFDVTLDRDEELDDLLLTGTSLRKYEHTDLQNPLRLFPNFPLLTLPNSTCVTTLPTDRHLR
jgi:hypothetical protein